jgi:hypothetical protein
MVGTPPARPWVWYPMGILPSTDHAQVARREIAGRRSMRSIWSSVTLQSWLWGLVGAEIEERWADISFWVGGSFGSLWGSCEGRGRGGGSEVVKSAE